MKKLISIVCILGLISTTGFAQNTKKVKKTKVKIVKEVVDADGNVTKEVVEKEGEEAERYIEKMELGEDQLVDVEIEVEKEISNYDHKRIEVETGDDGKRKVKVEVEKDGEKKELSWEDNGVTPDDIQVQLDAWGIDIDEQPNKPKYRRGGGKSHKLWKKKGKKHKKIKLHKDEYEREMSADEFYKILEENGPKLGVQIEDDSDTGAFVLDVFEESVAEEAGIEIGDVITKVNDQEIEDVADLIKAVTLLDVEEKAAITVKRGKEKKTLEANFQ